ncbi:MAG TPA: thioredoxin-like domain-containing protein [Flavobacterium sp.]|nr:thioredoxin-like domain-containing protein [Flavobacterium sp.]
MTVKKTYIFIFFATSLALLCASCNKEFKSGDYTAYFGGEVTNPTNPYVLFCRDSQVIDTLKLDKNNRFFIKFDSLTPGLYSFRHEPEYQYVYFDKNDSLMVSINSQDFDNSIVFSGRGDQKNNFLMEMYLNNEKDRENMFMVYDSDINTFNKTIDSNYAKNQKFYGSKKEEIQWSEDFDNFAKAALDFPYYSKKELYPVIHQLRTGNDVIEKLPKNYYAYRRKIDFNNAELSDFAPFVKYLTHMLNNVAAINYHNHFTEADLSLKTNINKLNIADTLIKNEKIKNTILNNIAFTYLLEDQNMVNNQKFLETYHKYSTDRSQKNEITKIGNAIQLLKAGNPLPKVKLYDTNGNMVSSDSLINKSTVIFFWTQKASTHLIEAHKKVLAYKKQYPNYQFVAVNLDDNQDKWKQVLANFKFDGITELRTSDFEDLKAKWAITKIHRTIVLSPDGTIKNAFTSLFDNKFEDNLR